MQRQISIFLKMPKFWTDAAGSTILRTKFNEGPEKNDIEWVICMTLTVKYVREKI